MRSECGVQSKRNKLVTTSTESSEVSKTTLFDDLYRNSTQFQSDLIEVLYEKNTDIKD